MPNTAQAPKQEDWMTKKWRPMMAITYMATIWFDFIMGPILFNVLQYFNPGQAVTSWTPLTLQGGGLYHLAMGTILGISAYTRGKEKEAMINAGMDPNASAVTPQAPVMGLPTNQTWQQPQQQQQQMSQPVVDITVDTSSPPPAFGAAPAAPQARVTPTRKIT